MLSSKETVKSFIQKRIFSELGLETSVSISEETGDIVVKRLLKVCKKSTNANQISLDDARAIDPNAKITDYVEVDMQPNMMVKVIIDQAIAESGKAEQAIRRKQEIVDSLKVEGISEHSLVFAEFVSETALGDCFFRLDGKYDISLTNDRKINNETFEAGREYPMIILSIEARKDGILLQGSRTTSILVEELIRMSLIDTEVPINIVKSSRIPGKMSKVIVSCDNPNLNATGIVVGNKGLRLQSVKKYLGGEVIEVVNYNESTPLQIAELLGIDRVKEIHYYFEDPEYFAGMKTLNKKKILAIVADEKVGQVVGKAGVSLQLTDKLSGWVIRVITETEYKEKFPEGGMYYEPDFDWMGLDLGYDYMNTYYGFYLKSIGFNSIADLKDACSSDLTRSRYITEGDAHYLLEVVGGIQFSYCCPTCGEEIPEGSSSCPHCGAIFSQEG